MNDTVELAIRIATGVAGGWLVITTVSGAIRSFVLPRNETVRLNYFVFSGIRAIFDWSARRASNFARRDRIMAHYAPVALVALPIGWLALVGLGYTGIYWALGVDNLTKSYELSGSSLLTLGTTSEGGFAVNVFSYSEATLGLLLLTLLISYLPTISQVFSKREVVVTQVELRAGEVGTAASLLRWLGHDGNFENDDAQWLAWEQWFVEIDESHTSLPVLVFFRSPQAGRSWVLTAGLLLDAANLLFSTLAVPRSRQVVLCFEAGVLALNRLHRFFGHKADTQPAELRSQEEVATMNTEHQNFSRSWQLLREADLPLVADEQAAWQAYKARRLRYAPALDFLSVLLMTPPTEN
ncbi:hypothetical protein HHL22_10540 [Hymenobacter sp. RP-2-7]|uniref:Two pore domain potassium channel family protein n=1 Tax=Hymenobacter polaris TaxID=2682546 RepID=A0A7Y0AE29_9BACT|nr:hypothetical protein [Hymenobacter polaris]NML65643.1 hypothetical protein [Hymenobacter polaris]